MVKHTQYSPISADPQHRHTHKQTHLTGLTKDPSLKSMGQLLQLLAPQQSMAEAYTFDVPAKVATGLDAVTLFASSAAKDGLIVFCNLNPAAQVCVYACVCVCASLCVTCVRACVCALKSLQ